MKRFVPNRRALLPGLLLCAGSLGALEYRLHAERGRLVGMSFERLEIVGGGAASAEVAGISHPLLGPLGGLSLTCRVALPRCAEGRIRWSGGTGAPVGLGFRRGVDRIVVDDDKARIELRFDPGGAAGLRVEALPLAWFAKLARVNQVLAGLAGRVDASLRWPGAGLRGEITISDGGFDTPDGWAAGASLSARAALAPAPGGGFDVEGAWTGGELLLGPLYLPPPDPAFRATARFVPAAGEWSVEDIRIDAGERLHLAARLDLTVGGRRVERVRVDEARADLAWLWRQGLHSIAATHGWGGLSPLGDLRASGAWSAAGLETARLALTGAAIDDDDGRLAARDLRLDATWRRDPRSLELTAGWTEASVYRVPLGSSHLALETTTSGELVLPSPWRIPILDGALVLDALSWGGAGAGDLEIGARLEPVDLAAVSRLFGWPVMGGSVSGRFTGLRLGPDLARFAGGMDLSLFDGSARIERLAVERPFGRDPALSAELTFDALDLALLTRAFEFGSMRGLLSGHVRDLRLLDWRPVGFDAWFETLERSPERRISQRAVDSLSSLSGAGGAAVSGLVMRWFESFPYRKLGLGCRLSANVCRMRGLRETDDGGYLILEGRAIPRLDIVGYQQRVDWPRLLEQLRAATAPPDSGTGGG